MIDPHDFSQEQMDLLAAFVKYIVDHPEVDETLPEQAILYFEVAGEPEFNAYSREMAELSQREQSLPLVCVRIKGLGPPEGSWLIDPVIESAPAVA